MSDRTIDEVLAELVEVIERDTIARLARKEYAARSPAPRTPAVDARRAMFKREPDSPRIPLAAHLRFMFGETFDQLTELFNWKPADFPRIREALETPPEFLRDLRRCLPTDVPLTFGDCWLHHRSTLNAARRRIVVGCCWQVYYGVGELTDMQRKQIRFERLCTNDACVNFQHHAVYSDQTWSVHHPPDVWQAGRWYYELCGLTAGETVERIRDDFGVKLSPMTIGDTWYAPDGGKQYRIQSALDTRESANLRRRIIRDRHLASSAE